MKNSEDKLLLCVAVFILAVVAGLVLQAVWL